MYPKKKSKGSYSDVGKVKSLMLKENPPIQRHVANALNCSVLTVNKIINSDFNLKKAKKNNVYRFLSVLSMNLEHFAELFIKTFI